MLSEKQRGVLRGMAIGIVITTVVLALAIFAAPAALTTERDLAAALAHTLQWDAILIATLAINVGLLARHRFFTPDDIDGGGLTKGTPKAQVLQSTLQNTLEQTVLGIFVHLIWTVTMPSSWQAAVPSAAILFLVGRILFMRGYANGAPSRALGFALTFYPSVAMLLAVGVRLVAQ